MQLNTAPPRSSRRSALEVEALEARRLLAVSIENPAETGSSDAVHGAGCSCGGCVPISALPGQLQAQVVATTGEGAYRDRSGSEFFLDPAPAFVPQLLEAIDGAGGGGGGGGGGASAAVPIFHSHISSPKKIFLDFDGHIVSGTPWNSYNNDNPIHAPPYSVDTDVSNFSSTELANIEEVWRRVAEDFAPFHVDVTTQDPGSAAFTAGATALRVMISTDVDDASMGGTGFRWFSGAGGVAYLGSWRWTSDTPVWVFENNLGNGFPKYVAEASSHEVGHAYDLIHDGIINGTAYYRGHGSGPTGWAPLMGVGYDRALSQWSKGEYASANNTEDDLALITQANNQVTFRTDDVGNTTGSSAALAFTDSSSTLRQFNGGGVVSTRTDVDVWRLVLPGASGNLTLEAAPAFFIDRYNNLDLKLDLLNSAGNLVQSVNPVDDVDAFLDLTLSGGTYYLRIDGVGKGDPSSGYTDYASLGQYDIFADWSYSSSGGGFNESGGRVDFQAEAFTGQTSGSGNASGHTWSQVSDAAAGGGLALLASPNTGVSTGDGTNGPRRDYAINFTNTGTYYVWVRLNGASGTDDSLHVGLNGSPVSTGGTGVTTAQHNQWIWTDRKSPGAVRVIVNVPSPGIHTFNLWMREDGTRVDQFTLSNNPDFVPGGGGGGGFTESGGRVDFQAEAFTGQTSGSGNASGHTWSQVSDAAAGGGLALLASPNTGVSTGDGTNGPRRDYAINFTNTGTYYVWVRLNGASGTDDSLHVGLNGSPVSTGGTGVTTAQHNQWIWTDRKSPGAVRVIVNVPSPGIHTFNLWMREDGTRVDQFTLSNNPDFVPGGGGGGGGGGTVNFENLAVGNQGSAGYNDPSGFRFVNLPGSGSGSQGDLLVHGPSQGFASKALQTSDWGRKIAITRTDGGNFSLTQFAYAAGRWGEAGDAVVTGFLAGGGTATANYSFSSKTLQTLTVNWSNLSRVEINWSGGVNGVYGVVDNFLFPAGFSETPVAA